MDGPRSCILSSAEFRLPRVGPIIYGRYLFDYMSHALDIFSDDCDAANKLCNVFNIERNVNKP